jgi:hypothetical protein
MRIKAQHAQSGAQVKIYNAAKQRRPANRSWAAPCTRPNPTCIAPWPTPAVPFLRVPDATEGDIHKAADIGALGIIVPAVDTVEKAEAAVGLSKYPPLGRGGGDHDRDSDRRRLCGKDRPGFTFFQDPGEAQLIHAGAEVNLAH